MHLVFYAKESNTNIRGQNKRIRQKLKNTATLQDTLHFGSSAVDNDDDDYFLVITIEKFLIGKKNSFKLLLSPLDC